MVVGERITVDLGPEVIERVRELASRSGRDLGEEIGALVAEAVRQMEERERRAWDAFDRIADGLFDGPGDLADRHDDYLYGPKPWPK